MLTCCMRHFSCLQVSDTRQWNCKYVFYNPFLGCWESRNSLKFSGIQLQNDTVVLSVLSLHFSFNQWFNLFFHLKPSFPTAGVTARSDTTSIMLPITYLHTILQQRCLEHPAFGVPAMGFIHQKTNLIYTLQTLHLSAVLACSTLIQYSFPCSCWVCKS